MATPEFDPLEKRCIKEAGNLGGQYLDSIGKTDLAALSGEEWQEFLERVIDGHGCAMRAALCRPDVPHP
jgi:hypothetical protein